MNNYAYFCQDSIIEFVKNADSAYAVLVIPFRIKLVWRLSESAFLRVGFGRRVFILNVNIREKNKDG